MSGKLFAPKGYISKNLLGLILQEQISSPDRLNARVQNILETENIDENYHLNMDSIDRHIQHLVENGYLATLVNSFKTDSGIVKYGKLTITTRGMCLYEALKEKN